MRWQEVNDHFSHTADTVVYKFRYITWICTHMEFRMEDFLLMSMCVCTSTHFIVTLSSKLSKETYISKPVNSPSYFSSTI